MAKKDKEVDVNIPQVYSKTEEFVNKHKDTMLTVLVAIGIIVAGIWVFKEFYLDDIDKEAQDAMFAAQRYFESDSLELALYGDGSEDGFLDIIDEYNWTDAANLAHYYAGVCYLHLGVYEDAIDNLESFNGDDIMVSTMAFGALGDAYMELGELDEGISYYKKASSNNENEFLTPFFLKKAAMASEQNEEYEDAKQMYETIKETYPQSPEGRDIDKYIARVNVQL